MDDDKKLADRRSVTLDLQKPGAGTAGYHSTAWAPATLCVTPKAHMHMLYWPHTHCAYVPTVDIGIRGGAPKRRREGLDD